MDVIDHKIVFTLFGIIPIRDTVVYTWITMGIIIVVALILKMLKLFWLLVMHIMVQITKTMLTKLTVMHLQQIILY